MSNKKKYIIASVTLGVIAASSGLLIGLTNLATEKTIAQNEINRFNAGIATIFGDNSTNELFTDSFENYKYLNECYTVNYQDGNKTGWAIKTTGSNMYGKISMIIGFNDSKERIGTYIITNEQSYASTLVDKYINPLNEGSRELDDVKCGATYGAKLVKSMIEEAQEYLNETHNL